MRKNKSNVDDGVAGDGEMSVFSMIQCVVELSEYKF